MTGAQFDCVPNPTLFMPLSLFFEGRGIFCFEM